jgi:hypothetical protein
MLVIIVTSAMHYETEELGLDSRRDASVPPCQGQRWGPPSNLFNVSGSLSLGIKWLRD